MGCKPITQKAKSSPFKMDTALVQNDRQIHKGFVDVAGAIGDGMDEAQKRIDANKQPAKKQVSSSPEDYGLGTGVTTSSGTSSGTSNQNKTKSGAQAYFTQASADAGKLLANGIKKK